MIVGPASAPNNHMNSILQAIPEELNRHNSFRSERASSFDEEEDEDEEEAFGPIRTTSEPVIEMVEEIKYGEEDEPTLDEIRRRICGPSAKPPFHSCIEQLEKLNKAINCTPLEKL